MQAIGTASPPDADQPVFAHLVAAFYDRVRADDLLGPLFNSAIAEADWPAHLARLTDFWSSVMVGSGRYHGNPMAAHLKHQAMMDPAMFDRWLALWGQAAQAHLPPDMAGLAIDKAGRIAGSLRLGLFYRLPPSVRPSA